MQLRVEIAIHNAGQTNFEQLTAVFRPDKYFRRSHLPRTKEGSPAYQLVKDYQSVC